MKAKEAKARIKINKLLEAAGWRFFDDENGPANIQLEANVKRQSLKILTLWLEKSRRGNMLNRSS